MVAFLHTDDWRINWLTRLTEQSPYVPLKGGSNALCLFPSWSLIFVSFRFCLEAGLVLFRFLPILTRYNGWNAEHSKRNHSASFSHDRTWHLFNKTHKNIIKLQKDECCPPNATVHIVCLSVCPPYLHINHTLITKLQR